MGCGNRPRGWITTAAGRRSPRSCDTVPLPEPVAPHSSLASSGAGSHIVPGTEAPRLAIESPTGSAAAADRPSEPLPPGQRSTAALPTTNPSEGSSPVLAVEPNLKEGEEHLGIVTAEQPEPTRSPRPFHRRIVGFNRKESEQGAVPSGWFGVTRWVAKSLILPFPSFSPCYSATRRRREGRSPIPG